MDTRKTVATITYHRSDNFGSVLQAYALGEKLRKLGYEQYIIDYRKPEVARLYRIFKPMNSPFNAVTNVYHGLHYGALRRRKKRYEQFRQKWLRLSSVYGSKESLMAAPPAADAYIVGSDQVWHTGIVDFDDSYLLDFVQKGRKISYAASGIKEYTAQDSVAHLQKKTADFAAVSVRENVAARRMGQGASVRIDPVLLLEKEDWAGLCTDPKRKKPYMFCYFAGMVSAEFEQFTRQKAEELGLERVIIMPQWRNLFRPGTNCYDAGPEEFVSLLAGASLVCTDSFHGTAFSVLMNKPFIVGQAEPFADDRIATVLGTGGLQEREIDPANPVTPELLQVDFTQADQVLAQLRQRDSQWLQEVIG